MFHQCRLPITSYGIVAFNKSSDEIRYLMIRRKDSFGYIDFIRGKYSPLNVFQIQNCINEMSVDEKERILTTRFEMLWRQMWGHANHNMFRNEEFASEKKFDQIVRGDNPESITLKDIVQSSGTRWKETEWEFPKGRRDGAETDIQCALREFEEETGISSSKLQLIDNVLPYEETFIGTNHKSYKHKYFLAFMEDTSMSMTDFQNTEVSDMKWKTFHECLECMRPYNLEKKRIISNINETLNEYSIHD